MQRRMTVVALAVELLTKLGKMAVEKMARPRCALPTGTTFEMESTKEELELSALVRPAPSVNNPCFPVLAQIHRHSPYFLQVGRPVCRRAPAKRRRSGPSGIHRWNSRWTSHVQMGRRGAVRSQ